MARVRRAGRNDVAGCVDVLRELPDFFTVDTHQTFADQLPLSTTWVAQDESDEICGLLQAMPRRTSAAEITFAAVRPSLRRRGIGRALLSVALRELASNGVVLVEAKTLDASANYEPYDGTRAFWESGGFVQIDTIDPLPGWQPGNPSAIYVASLATTVTWEFG